MRIPPAWCTPCSCIKAFVRDIARGARSKPGRQGRYYLTAHESITDAYVCRLLPLTCLAPDIVEAILDGRQPKGLRLAEVLGNGPLGVGDQRVKWSFSNDTDLPQ